jgi:HK97 family phage prohead protease
MGDSLQFKAMSGQLSIDEAMGIVECFVAAVGNKDSVGDIVMPGAFTSSLKRRKPRVVWGHDWNKPIGKVIDMYEVPASDPRLPAKMKKAGVGGLFAKVQFNLRSERGREAFNDILFFGEEQEWSIGYKTLDSIYSSQRQANLLKELELYEVSPVLHGANQLTATISIKSEMQDEENQVDSFRKSEWNLFDPEFAQMVKEKYPTIWAKGGNIRGNDQYAKLLPIAKRGGKATTDTEVAALELREAWVARHKQDFRLPGVVAQMKWLAVGSRGEGYMKDVIREAIAKLEAKNEKGDDAVREMAEGLMEFIADRYGDKYAVSIEGDDKDYDEDYEEDDEDYGEGGDGFVVDPQVSMAENLADAIAEEYGGPVKIRDMSRNTVVFDHMHDGEPMTMRASWHSERGLIMVGSAEEVRAETVYIPVEDEDDEEYGSEAPDVPGPGAGMAGDKDCGCGCGGKGMCGVKQIAGRVGGSSVVDEVDRDGDGVIFDGTDRETAAPKKPTKPPFKKPQRDRNYLLRKPKRPTVKPRGEIDNSSRRYRIDKYDTHARIEEDGSGFVELRDGGRYPVGSFDDPNAMREVPTEHRKRVQALRKYQNQRNMLAARQNERRRRGKKVAYDDIMEQLDVKVGRTVAGRNMERLRDAINLLTEILNEGDASTGLERKGDDYLVLGTTPDAMFGLKSLLDSIAEYHGAEVSLDTADGSWIAIKADSQELIDAVATLVDGHGDELRVKSLDLYGTEDGDAVPFDRKSALGKLRKLSNSSAGGGKGRGTRKLIQQAVNPKARDADGDGVVQEGTTAMRNVTSKPSDSGKPALKLPSAADLDRVAPTRKPIGSDLPESVKRQMGWYDRKPSKLKPGGGGSNKPPTPPKPPKPPAGDTPEPPERPTGRAGKLLNGLPSADEFKAMERGSGPLGSQGGRWYTDDKGQRYLVKPAKSEAHAQNEMSAHLFYKTAGLATDETGIYESNGKWYIAKKAVQTKDGGLGKPIGDDGMTEALQEQARDGFAYDALASSWDVFGLVGDNVILDDDDKIHRIDVGGSMQFRAMGGDKGVFNPGEPWTEPFSMRSSDQGRTFYGDMSDDEAFDRLSDLADFDIDSYDDAMKAAGIDSATRSRITDTLRDRIDNQLPGILEQLTPEDEAWAPELFSPYPNDKQSVSRLRGKVNTALADLFAQDGDKGRKNINEIIDMERARERSRINVGNGLYMSGDKQTVAVTATRGARNLDVLVLRRDGKNLDKPELTTYFVDPPTTDVADELSALLGGGDGTVLKGNLSGVGGAVDYPFQIQPLVDSYRDTPDGLLPKDTNKGLSDLITSNFVKPELRDDVDQEWADLKTETADLFDDYDVDLNAEGPLDFYAVERAANEVEEDDEDAFEEYVGAVAQARDDVANLLEQMSIDASVLDDLSPSEIRDLLDTGKYQNMKGRLLALLANYDSYVDDMGGPSRKSSKANPVDDIRSQLDEAFELKPFTREKKVVELIDKLVDAQDASGVDDATKLRLFEVQVDALDRLGGGSIDPKEYYDLLESAAFRADELPDGGDEVYERMMDLFEEVQSVFESEYSKREMDVIRGITDERGRLLDP